MYIDILEFFVDRLILVGKEDDWIDFQYKIDEFVDSENIEAVDKIWISTNYAWKLFIQ